ncbi:hypothetical protein ABPG77_009416 [Micractinium sp. CCAP 211/92]
MRRFTLPLLLGLLLVCCAAPAQAGLGDIVDSVTGALTGAWDTVKNAVTGAYTTVECKVVDWTSTNITVCAEAPDSNLCTTECKAQLDKVPDACIQQIIDAIAKAGDQNATARWEAQLTACNITYTQPTNGASAYGSVLLPLVVMAASVALVELLRP